MTVKHQHFRELIFVKKMGMMCQVLKLSVILFVLMAVKTCSALPKQHVSHQSIHLIRVLCSLRAGYDGDKYDIATMKQEIKTLQEQLKYSQDQINSLKQREFYFYVWNIIWMNVTERFEFSLPWTTRKFNNRKGKTIRWLYY